MRLILVGTSHHLAPIELRERFALPPRRAEEVAARFAERGFEAVCLSTCNRTELYLAGADAANAEAGALATLAELGGLREDDVEPVVYRLHDGAAALHLFRVAAGLDSLVPGEGEILGQVRAAFEAGRAGPLLGRLFRAAIHAGKKARAETALGESPASASAAAAALVQQVFGDLAGRRILVIGAGKIGELAARNLASRGAQIGFVANRTLDRAADLARRFGAEPLPLDGVETELARADVVVSSTSAPGFVLDREQVERALRGRRRRPLFFVDLAVPRDVDPAIHELDGCFVYDIDEDRKSVV
jgi:glutamyl-tRNA reductase